MLLFLPLGQRSHTHHSVPAQGGLVSKGAFAEPTHVGLLSRMNPLVPLQRVELSEVFITGLAAVRTLT